MRWLRDVTNSSTPVNRGETLFLLGDFQDRLQPPKEAPLWRLLADALESVLSSHPWRVDDKGAIIGQRIDPQLTSDLVDAALHLVQQSCTATTHQASPSPSPRALAGSDGAGAPSESPAITPATVAEQDLDGDLALCAGGFEFRGQPHTLTGRPLDMLRALLAARFRCLGVDELRVALAIDDVAVSFPEQVVKDSAKDLRRALRQAVESAGLSCDDPLPSQGKGKSLSYRLSLP
jgi:hypothetical protein